ncbi:MAG: hypothetical protein AAGF24_09620 [Cyanobacteria bacterium P01_H01_bin.121]
MLSRLRRSRAVRTFTNDLVLICLTIGYHWSFLADFEGRFVLQDYLYGFSHLVIGVFGIFSLYFESSRYWRICLVLMGAAFLQDAVFYFVAAKTSSDLSLICLDRTWVLSFVFTWLCYSCFTRLLGLANTGNLVPKEVNNAAK